MSMYVPLRLRACSRAIGAIVLVLALLTLSAAPDRASAIVLRSPTYNVSTYGAGTVTLTLRTTYYNDPNNNGNTTTNWDAFHITCPHADVNSNDAGYVFGNPGYSALGALPSGTSPRPAELCFPLDWKDFRCPNQGDVTVPDSEWACSFKLDLRANVPKGWGFYRWDKAPSPCQGSKSTTCSVPSVASCDKDGACTYDQSIADIVAGFQDTQSPQAVATGLCPVGCVRTDPGGGMHLDLAVNAVNNEEKEKPSFLCSAVNAATVSAPCTGVATHDVSGVEDGYNTIHVVAVDPSGNKSTTPFSYGWVQRYPPRTSLSSDIGDGDLVGTTDATFTFSSNYSDQTTFRCSLDGGAPQACQSPLRRSGLPDGDHSVQVQAVRSVSGQEIVDPAPPARHWRVDTTGPATAIVEGPAQGVSTNAKSAVFAFASSESAIRFECKLDDGPWETCRDRRTYDGLPPGRHTVLVRAVDAAGNADPNPASRTWTVTTDADGDGYERGVDCDDSNAKIHPGKGVTDIPENGVDEDCNGADAKRPALDAVVRLAWVRRGGKIVIKSLEVAKGPKGAFTVEVRCKGAPRACLKGVKRRRIAGVAKTKLPLRKMLKAIELRPGTAIQVRVLQAGHYGVVTTFTMTSRGVKRVDKCYDGRTKKLLKTEQC